MGFTVKLPGRSGRRLRDLPELKRPEIELRRPDLSDVRLPSMPSLPELHRPDLPEIRRPELPELRWRRDRRRAAIGTAVIAAGAAALGAVTAYFLDPDRGRGRRSQTVDRAAAALRRTLEALTRTGRKVSSDAAGLGQRLANRSHGDGVAPNDASLAHRVETELFRDPSVPKGQININAEGGVVVLRGVVETADQIPEIESRVLKIDGVYAVRNLLHLAESPAPMQTGYTQGH